MTATASTVYVDWSGGGDHTTIQEGIAAASRDDTVLVAAGTYSGPLNRDITFGGKDVYLISETGPDFTIIDCGNAARGFVFTNGETQSAIVEGFTIMNGVAPSSGETAEWGGALYCTNSAVVILGCSFEDCYAGYGGTMYCGISARVAIVSCTFEANHPYGFGLGAHWSTYSTCEACAAPVQEASWGSIKAMYR